MEDMNKKHMSQHYEFFMKIEMACINPSLYYSCERNINRLHLYLSEILVMSCEGFQFDKISRLPTKESPLFCKREK